MIKKIYETKADQLDKTFNNILINSIWIGADNSLKMFLNK
jgi:hypothetical protein